MREVPPNWEGGMSWVNQRTFLHFSMKGTASHKFSFRNLLIGPCSLANDECDMKKVQGRFSYSNMIGIGERVRNLEKNIRKCGSVHVILHSQDTTHPAMYVFTHRETIIYICVYSCGLIAQLSTFQRINTQQNYHDYNRPSEHTQASCVFCLHAFVVY